MDRARARISDKFYKEKNKLLITKQHLRFVKCGQ